MKRKKIPYGTKLPVLLTPQELNLIKENTFCDPDFGKMGVVEGKNIKIMMNLDDMKSYRVMWRLKPTTPKTINYRRNWTRYYETSGLSGYI